jgi:prefoldin beta subunit
MSEEETYDQINQLQMIEQNLQAILLQRQNFSAKLMEIESALREVGKVDEAYRIIGNIMILSKKAEIEEDLGAKKEMLDIRIKTLEKQEQKLREKAAKLQKEVLGKINKEGSDEHGKGN